MIAAEERRICGWCQEEIDPASDSYHPMLNMHRECVVRDVAGPLVHLERDCTCWGGEKACEDSTRGTKRDAAKSVLAWFLLVSYDH